MKEKHYNRLKNYRIKVNEMLYYDQMCCSRKYKVLMDEPPLPLLSTSLLQKKSRATFPPNALQCRIDCDTDTFCVLHPHAFINKDQLPSQPPADDKSKRKHLQAAVFVSRKKYTVMIMNRCRASVFILYKTQQHALLRPMAMETNLFLFIRIDFLRSIGASFLSLSLGQFNL